MSRVSSSCWGFDVLLIYCIAARFHTQLLPRYRPCVLRPDTRIQQGLAGSDELLARLWKGKLETVPASYTKEKGKGKTSYDRCTRDIHKTVLCCVVACWTLVHSVARTAPPNQTGVPRLFRCAVSLKKLHSPLLLCSVEASQQPPVRAVVAVVVRQRLVAHRHVDDEN